jgi:hypothetical protein
MQQCQRLAERFRLATTGGSDYHGERKGIALGDQHVPGSIYEQLRELRSGFRV